MGNVDEGEGVLYFTPNPTGGELEVKTLRPEGVIYSVVVYNLLGENIYRTSGERSNSAHLDLTSYTTGTYYVKVETSRGIYIRKIVKK